MRERTRDLVMRYGRNAASYQIVNESILKWFHDDAVLGYVTVGNWRVVAGAPVCDPARLKEVLRAWQDECSRVGARVCYFACGQRVSDAIGSFSPVSSVVMGSQPSWNPENWAAITQRDASLRAQFNRARNKGVTVSEWCSERAKCSPELERVLLEWLRARGLPPLHFLVEPDTLGFLRDRRVFVAERSGAPVAFLVLCPVTDRRGWLTEQFPRLPSAPNGTVELLLDSAARVVAGEGAQYLTMGLVPLAEHGLGHANPWWLRGLSAWARAHGLRFYNFGGLEQFKQKFHPEAWETIYAAVNEPAFTPSALYAIATAFSQQPAWKAVSIGLAKAMRTELRSLAGGHCRLSVNR